MPVDDRLLTVAIPYHTEELYRLLSLQCRQSAPVPFYKQLLLVALVDFIEAEREYEVRHDA